MHLKKGLIPILFLSILPLALAEITMQMPEAEQYNWGDLVDASISIKETQKQSGFFQLHLQCDSYDVPYYVAPITVESETRFEVTMPEIRIPQDVQGSCKLRADFVKTNGEVIAAAFSKQFLVSNKLSIQMQGDLKVKPGETIIIAADVFKESQASLESGSASISFGEYIGVANVENGKLAHAIDVGMIPRGFYALKVQVNDSYGNGGELLGELEVEGLPKRIAIGLSNQAPIPGDTILITPTIYDQTDEWLNGSISLQILDSKKQILLSQNVLSGSEAAFPILNTFKPGNYSIEAQFATVEGSSSLPISPYHKILMRTQGPIVHVDNVGNIPFKEEVTILIMQGDKQVPLQKKISLKVGEQEQIDLSKEVASGIYDINLPSSYADNSSAYAQIAIEDNRNVLKRGASGIKSATGFAVSTTKEYVSKPFFAASLIAFIVIVIAALYARTMWRQSPPKKNDKTDDIFKDFKYDE